MVAHPDIGQCLSFLLLGLALLLVSQPVAMYHLTHTITSSFFIDNIYLEGTFLAGKRNKTEGTFLAGKRNITELEGTFLAGKRNKPEGAFLAGKKELSRYLPAIQGLCELFQPSGASGSYAQIFPTQTTYKQDICTYTRKKLTMIQKHSVAEMGFHESPLTSRPLSIKGLSRGEWSVG